VAGSVIASFAQAATIASWTLQGTTNGNNASASGSGIAGQTTALNVTRGAGLTATGTPASNCFSADGWTGQTTDFLSFGFSVSAGYSVDLTNLFIGSRSSNTGPGSLGLFYSGDGFTTNLFTFTQPTGGAFLNSNIALALNGLTGNVEFRIRALNNVSANGGTTGSTGTFRITNYFNPADTGNFSFTGNVIPTPGSLALMGLGGLVAARRRR
jgi:uncharacterized protein (TIGR03382 family)